MSARVQPPEGSIVAFNITGAEGPYFDDFSGKVVGGRLHVGREKPYRWDADGQCFVYPYEPEILVALYVYENGTWEAWNMGPPGARVYGGTWAYVT